MIARDITDRHRTLSARRAPAGADLGAVARRSRRERARRACCSSRRSRPSAPTPAPSGSSNAERDRDRARSGARALGGGARGLAELPARRRAADVGRDPHRRGRLDDVVRGARRGATRRSPARARGSPSLAVIPLAVEGRPFGADLAQLQAAARASTSRSVPSSRAAAQQAAHALERARLYEAQRQVAPSGSRSWPRRASCSRARSIPTRRCASSPTSRSSGFADWCGIELVDEDGRPAQRRRRPRRPGAGQARRRAARRATRSTPTPRPASPSVIRTRRARSSTRRSPTRCWSRRARDDEHLRMIRELGLVSVMIVPLAARGRAIGAHHLRRRRVGACGSTSATSSWPRTSARRAALAIDNAHAVQAASTRRP